MKSLFPSFRLRLKGNVEAEEEEEERPKSHEDSFRVQDMRLCPKFSCDIEFGRYAFFERLL